MHTGRIPIAKNHYRESVNRINNIIATLNSSDRIEEVSAINLPVEVRPEKKFASETRKLSAEENARRRDGAGLFSLKVIMKAPEHV